MDIWIFLIFWKECLNLYNLSCIKISIQKKIISICYIQQFDNIPFKWWIRKRSTCTFIFKTKMKLNLNRLKLAIILFVLKFSYNFNVFGVIVLDCHVLKNKNIHVSSSFSPHYLKGRHPFCCD